MNLTIRQLLADTLKDLLLSRRERSSLQALLDQIDLNDRQREKLKQVAFELAREALAETQDLQVLDWLQDLTGLIDQFDQRSPEIAEAWFSPINDCVTRILQLLEAAQRSIDICVFTITDNYLTDAILDAARRGVKIQIISDNDKAFDRGSDIERLRAAKIPVRVDATEFHMHHKFAIFDRQILLSGSYNWTVGAARNNQENFLITSNLQLVKAYQTEFDRLWHKLV
ncbi:MAG: phospholipase D-like domain-containing protein [Elainellaceae cyanobacterium]